MKQCKAFQCAILGKIPVLSFLSTQKEMQKHLLYDAFTPNSSLSFSKNMKHERYLDIMHILGEKYDSLSLVYGNYYTLVSCSFMCIIPGLGRNYNFYAFIKLI